MFWNLWQPLTNFENISDWCCLLNRPFRDDICFNFGVFHVSTPRSDVTDAKNYDVTEFRLWFLLQIMSMSGQDYRLRKLTTVLGQNVHFVSSPFFLGILASHWEHLSLIVHFSQDSSWPQISPSDIQIEWNTFRINCYDMIKWQFNIFCSKKNIIVADIIYLGATSFHVSTAVTKLQWTYFFTG